MSLKSNKNIIIVHLESLSVNTFNNQIDYLPNITKTVQESVFYKNYFSTATSTLMVMADLFGMDVHYTDSKKSIRDFLESNYEKEFLWDVLEKDNYACENIFYRLNEEEHPNFNKFKKNILGDRETYFLDDLNDIGEKIDELSGHGKFGLFLFDGESHIDCYSEEDTIFSHAEMIYGERFRKLDNTVGWLFSFLKEKRLLDSTLVVLYGDHGDDIYSHGFREGYTHAIKPYGNLIKCPLCIYGQERSEVTDEMCSTEDIGKIVISELGLSEKFESRKYTFSRNIFPSQRKRAGVLEKAFAVNKGEWQLLCSKRGLEMYNLGLDPFCQKNMLDFFVLQKGNLRYRKVCDTVLSSHYRGLMNSRLKKEITENFKELFDIMSYEITKFGEIPCAPRMNRIVYTESLKSRIYRNWHLYYLVNGLRRRVEKLAKN